MNSLGYLLVCCSSAALAIACQRAHAQVPAVLRASLSPASNAGAAPRAAPVTIPFSQPIDSATARNIRLVAQYRGRRPARASTSGSTVVLAPLAAGGAPAFKPGETIWVTVPGSVQSTAKVAAAPYTYQFTAAAGKGSGLFSAAPNVTSNGYTVRVGDLDSDGDLDLVTYGSAATTVLKNDGSGHFSSFTAFPYTPGGAVDLLLSDLDNDGDLDMAQANGQYFLLAFNDGSGYFKTQQRIYLTDHMVGVAAGDVDSDGDADLLLADYAASSVSVCLNDGSGTFARSQAVDVAGNPRQVSLADADSDGDLDLLAACAGLTGKPGAVSVRFNDGTGTFGGGQDVGSGAYHLIPGDLDGDGDLDILCDNPAVIYLNDGAGAFARTTRSEVPRLSTATYNVGLSLGDIDGDGDLDFVVNDYFGTGSTWLNGGDGVFKAGQSQSLGFGSYDSALADIDGDADLDLLVQVAGAAGSSVLNVRLNTNGPLASAAPAAAAAGALYPNPVQQGQEVLLTVPATTVALVEVHNALGQLVRPAQRLPVGAGQATGTLATAGLATGIYLVSLLTDKTTSRQRLVLY